MILDTPSEQEHLSFAKQEHRELLYTLISYENTVLTPSEDFSAYLPSLVKIEDFCIRHKDDFFYLLSYSLSAFFFFQIWAVAIFQFFIQYIRCQELCWASENTNISQPNAGDRYVNKQCNGINSANKIYIKGYEKEENC